MKKLSHAFTMWLIIGIAVTIGFVFMIVIGYTLKGEFTTVVFPARQVDDGRAVRSVSNKFSEFKNISFGGGGAGGIAVPEIEYLSFEDFVKDTRGVVYLVEEQTLDLVVMRYYSFTSDNSILLSYSDIYEVGRGGIVSFVDGVIIIRDDSTYAAGLFMGGVLGVPHWILWWFTLTRGDAIKVCEKVLRGVNMRKGR